MFAAARGGRFRVTVSVVLAYLGVAAAHALFNGATWLAQTLPWSRAAAGGVLLLFELVFVLGTGLAWLLIARRIGRVDAQRSAMNAIPAG